MAPPPAGNTQHWDPPAVQKGLRAGPGGAAPQGCTAKVKVPCGKILPSLDPGAPNPGSSLAGGAKWGVTSGTIWAIPEALGEATSPGPLGMWGLRGAAAAPCGNNGGWELGGSSGGCSPWMPELLLLGEHPGMLPPPSSSLCLFLPNSCWQSPPTPSLPVPGRPGCLRKVELNVWKEQISDETGPFMLSDIEFRAEY